MSRPRNPTNKALPEYVYPDRSRYVLRRPGEKPLRMCRVDVPLSEVWRLYEEINGRQGQRESVRWLFAQYLASEQFHKNLAKRTQRDYGIALERASAWMLEANGKPIPMGALPHVEVRRGLIRVFLDTYGAPVAANRIRAAMSAAWSWARERDIATDNPCIGVRRNPEKPSNRYVTDDEYQAVYAIAPRYVRAAMELAYLCVCRKGEILGMKLSQVSDDGIHIARTKGSIPNIVGWSDRLRAAYALARGTVSSAVYVLCNDRGQPVREAAFDTAWQRAQHRAGQAGWTFHALKAKGYTDHNGDPHRVAGHKSNLRGTYFRKLDMVEPTR